MVSALGQTRTVFPDCTDCCPPNVCAATYPPHINSPIYVAAELLLDVAGFTDSGGVDCTNTNQTFPCATQSGLVLGDDLTWEYGDAFSTISIVCNSYSGDIPPLLWTATIQFACPAGGSAVYKYTCPIADFNGCGSVTLTLASTTGPCSCGTPPSTVVLRSKPGDPGNCPCPCLLNCSQPFPTGLCVKVDNFTGPNAGLSLYYFFPFNVSSDPVFPPGSYYWGSTFLSPAFAGGFIDCYPNGTVSIILTDAGAPDYALAASQSCSSCPVTYIGVNYTFSSGSTVIGTCDVEIICNCLTMAELIAMMDGEI